MFMVVAYIVHALTFCPYVMVYSLYLVILKNKTIYRKTALGIC